MSSREIDLSLIWPLACRSSASGYRGVYRHARGKWLARVRMLGVLRAVCPPLPTPAQAATRLARWHQEQFGGDWTERLKFSKTNPWKIRKSPKYGGYLLTVFEFGIRTEVVEMDAQGEPQLKVFPSVRAAKGYAKVWMRNRYGLFTHLAWWYGKGELKDFWVDVRTGKLLPKNAPQTDRDVGIGMGMAA